MTNTQIQTSNLTDDSNQINQMYDSHTYFVCAMMAVTSTLFFLTLAIF